MDETDKIVRNVAFLLSAAIASGLFAMFTTWEWSHLEPAQQEVIGLAFANPFVHEEIEASRVGPIAEGGHRSAVGTRQKVDAKPH